MRNSKTTGRETGSKEASVKKNPLYRGKKNHTNLCSRHRITSLTSSHHQSPPYPSYSHLSHPSHPSCIGAS